MTQSRDSCYLLLGESIGDQDRYITGSKLPTYRQVLKNYLFFRRFVYDPKSKVGKVDDSAKKLVLKAVRPHYIISGIKMKSDKNCFYHIGKLYKMFESAQKNGFLSGELKDKLDKTMELWDKQEKERLLGDISSNVAKEDEKKELRERLKFLISMETDRRACYRLTRSQPDNQIDRGTSSCQLGSFSVFNGQVDPFLFELSDDELEEDRDSDCSLYTPPHTKRKKRAGITPIARCTKIPDCSIWRYKK